MENDCFTPGILLLLLPEVVMTSPEVAPPPAEIPTELPPCLKENGAQMYAISLRRENLWTKRTDKPI